MNNFKFVIFPGILLFCQNGFSPLEISANARFNVKEVDEVLNTINSFTPEQNRKYDEELIKRISAIKRLREKYRRSKMSEMNSDLLQRRRADYYRKMIKNDLWINDPYSKASYNSKRYGPYSYSRGKKDTYNPAASEFGVFKVKHKNYYMWAAHEKDYEDEGKAMGEVEVDDPLNCLSEDEKNEKLKLICQKEKYDEPFRDPKIIEFLKGVYYNFLARSKNTSASQPGQSFSISDMVQNRIIGIPINKFSENDIEYYTQLQHMHTFIGMFLRTPHPDADDMFPKYLPIDMPRKYEEFYRKFVELSKENSIDIYRFTFNPFNKNVFINPKKIRVFGEHGYELATYCNNTKPDWTTKLGKLFHKSYVENTNFVGDMIHADQLDAFRKKTGCLPHITGMVVNPIAPYIGITPDAIAYCRGHPYMVLIKTPIAARTRPLSTVMNKLAYLTNKNGKYSLRKRSSVYATLQMGMGILRLDRAFFGLYGKRKDELKLSEVKFDKLFFKNLINNIYKVYFSKLLPRFFSSTLMNAYDNDHRDWKI